MDTVKYAEMINEELCRTCLSKENKLYSIFDISIGSINFSYILSEMTGLKIRRGDGFPTTICSDCKAKAEEAFAFKKKSLEAHVSLKGLLEKEKDILTNQSIIYKPNDVDVKTENVLHDNDDYLDGDFNILSNSQDDLNDLSLDMVKNESQEMPFLECKSCYLVFESQFEFDEHKKKKCIKVELEDQPQSTACPLCGICYEGVERLNKHMCDYHTDLMGPKKRGRPKKVLTSAIINKLSDNGLFITPTSNKNYDCAFCKMQFDTKKEFVGHMMTVHRDLKVLCCVLCKKMYLKKKYFDLHNCVGEHRAKNESPSNLRNDENRKIDFVNEIYLNELLNPDCDIDNFSVMQVCSACNSMFLSVEDLINHHDAEHPELSLRCNICTKVFATVKSAARHRSVCKQVERKHKCDTCGLKFAYEISLNKHILRYHEGQSVSVKFMDPKAKLNERQYQCDTCNRCFHRKELLVRHTKIHMPNEKYYECDVCEKKFHRSDNLRSHKRVHDLQREKNKSSNCLCSFCGRSFSNSSNLIVHMRRHTGEKPYKCDFCGKGFPRSSDLQCHRRSHTGEKPCVCSICRKGFSRSNKLSRHMRVHTGQRPYKCTYCDKAFSQSNDLTLHIRRHTGDRPYICDVCGDRFIQGSALQNHRRAHGHFSTPGSEGHNHMKAITYTVQNVAARDRVSEQVPSGHPADSALMT